MHNYHQIEFEANEHQQMLRVRAEERHLAEMCADNHPRLTQRIRGWVGAHLMQWGRTLQGSTVTLPLPINTQPQTAQQA